MAKTLIGVPHTASTSSEITIASGIDGTYSVYEFHWTSIHPGTAFARLTFQMDSGSGFASNMTTTNYLSSQGTGGASSWFGYRAIRDQANGTAYQPLCGNINDDSDDVTSGILTVYNPSSSRFIKHFTSFAVASGNGGVMDANFVAGYFHTTSALTRIEFEMTSGNIDSGVIKMFGVS